MKFYDSFRQIETENFSYMRLSHWSSDVQIKVQIPDENSKMTAPYLYVESRYGRVPWIPTQIEMFSDKWEVY